jgi:RNA polymerase sigma-70 factor, ECF subfamily
MKPVSSSQSEQSDIFLRAYDEYADAIFRFCLTKVRARDLATDITQDTFIRTWEYISQGADIKNIRALLYHIARNIIIDQSRRKSTSSLDSLLEAGVDIPDTISLERTQERAEMGRVTKALDHLNESYREVILMHYVDGLSVQEISHLLNIKPNTVSVRLRRALQQARSLFTHKDSSS